MMTFDTWFKQFAPDISERSVKAVMELKAEGATLPFIARYRKEKTGNLDEVQIQKVFDNSSFKNDYEKLPLSE